MDGGSRSGMSENTNEQNGLMGPMLISPSLRISNMYPTNQHRTNPAELAIRTAKYHFLATLSLFRPHSPPPPQPLAYYVHVEV